MKRFYFKKKLTPLKKLRTIADGLLTPLIKRLFPRCLLCGNPTQVAHHYIKKSESNRLRYIVENLINLCTSCHCALHNHETIYGNRIVKIKGQEWHDKLIKMKQEYIKVDRGYYENAITKLNELYKIL
jgi:5-methylcytosine-specific restriction endonuclease McrA